jgi:hypothetical protein
MTRITCTYGELDDETQEYLRDVHKYAGKKCPGVYVEGNPAPWGKVAIAAGPIVALVGFIWAFNTNKDAYAAAMLLAGTAMLGGWLTWFGFRELLAGKGNKVYGRFTYFDPTHVYQVTGDEITLTEVAAFKKVVAKQGGVLFSLGKDDKVFVPLARAAKAELVERFYNAILDVEEHDDPKWQKLDPADLGGVAKHIAVEGGFPMSARSADLKVDQMPQEPRQESGGGGLLRLMVPFAGAAAAFLVGFLIFKSTRDNGAFSAAKAGGAPGLRGYLMDERNKSNRDEAKKLLAAMYDAPIAKVTAAMPAEQGKAREGLLAVLESLREATQPVLSMSVKETSDFDGKEARETQIRTELADGLGLYVGQELIAFVKNPDDKKAHVEINYTVAATGEVTWKPVFRVSPDGEAVEGAENKFSFAGVGADATAVPGLLKQEFFMKLFQSAPPLPPPPPVMDEGDW